MDRPQIGQHAPTMLLSRIARHLPLLARQDDPCHPQPNIDLCEKPANSSNSTGLIVGVTAGIIVVIVAAIVVFFLIRRKRIDAAEDRKNGSNPQELDDYGLDFAPNGNNRTGTAAPKPSIKSSSYPQREGRGNSLDNLERSLRGHGQDQQPPARQGNPYAARVDDDVSADMKPVMPSERV